MQKTSRGARWLAAILLGLVVVGIGGLFVGLRPYWVARCRGRRSNLQVQRSRQGQTSPAPVTIRSPAGPRASTRRGRAPCWWG